MTNETTVRLSEIDNIIGIKEASSDPVQIARVIRDTPDDFRIWSGNDDETFGIMSMGGFGVVSVAAHLVGNQIKQMMGYTLEGDVEAAGAEHLRLLDIFKGLFIVSNPIPVKYGLNRSGFRVGEPRLPLVPPDEKTAAQLDALLDRYDIDIPVPTG
jgi:4-hydroxy-tetrahydrodipicolinate synthase